MVGSRGLRVALVYVAMLALVAAIGTALGACGEGHKATTRSEGVTVVGRPDNEGTPAIDGDDETTVDFGHVADANEARPVSAFVQRYMRLAAAGAVAPMCRLTARCSASATAGKRRR